MRTIYKYQMGYIDFGGTKKSFEMPWSSKIIHVDNSIDIPHSLVLWALVDTNARTEIRHFEVVGTGHPVPEFSTYIGTIRDEFLVLHLFEVFVK